MGDRRFPNRNFKHRQASPGKVGTATATSHPDHPQPSAPVEGRALPSTFCALAKLLARQAAVEFVTNQQNDQP